MVICDWLLLEFLLRIIFLGGLLLVGLLLFRAVRRLLLLLLLPQERLARELQCLSSCDSPRVREAIKPFQIYWQISTMYFEEFFPFDFSSFFTV